MRRLGRLLTCCLLVGGVVGTAAAQTASDRASVLAPKVEVTPYVGGARHSLAGTFLGVTPDRNHLFLGVHISVNVVRGPRWTLGYAPEIVPLLLISNNPKYQTVTFSNGQTAMMETGRGPVAGVGISPIGLESQLRVGSRWRLFAAGAGGCVWFTRNVPVAESRRFNFTFELGGGAIWSYSSRWSLRMGCKFHHLSNAYTAPANPGIDGVVFFAGFSRAI
ncbi:MAG: acyloxyacyl hydrolase [Acidobacteria bacterium]|nr:acyloxyacyl hydrolase [Acidobacteriota bacterium]